MAQPRVSVSVSVLVFVALVLSPSAAKETLIRVTPGETVILPCHLPSNTPVIVTEWTRPELVPEYVLFYRDGQSDPENQLASFRDRVALKDERMKDGDVSLVLQNVVPNDSGIYECHVWRNSRKRSTFGTDPISTIRLTVEPGPEHADPVAAVVAVTALVLVLMIVVIVVMLRKRRISQQKSSAGHGPELQEMTLISVTSQNPQQIKAELL